MGTGSTTYPSPNALVETTVSNTSTTVATINLQRAGLYVFNQSATITLWVAPAGNCQRGQRCRLGGGVFIAGGDVRAA